MRRVPGVASALCCRLRSIRASPALRAHRRVPAESRPDGAGSPVPLISPPGSALCPCFCSALLPGDFHYKYPLIMRARRGEQHWDWAHTKRKKRLLARTPVIIRLGLPSPRIHMDSTWQSFTCMAPLGVSSCFHFIMGKLGCQGELLPPNEFAKGDSCTSFIICFESNFTAAPQKPLCSLGRAMGEHKYHELWPVSMQNLLLYGYHPF